MQKFERPKYRIEQLEEQNNYGKFIVSPLEQLAMLCAESCCHPYRVVRSIL